MVDRRERESAGVAMMRGALAGVLGALVMGLLMMSVSANRADGFWTPLQLIGGVVFGTGYQSAGSAALGLLIHLAVGAGFGALFSLITRRIAGIVNTTILGIVFAVAVFAPMTYLVLPIVDPVMYRTMHLGVLFMAHIVYGLVTGIATGALRHARGGAGWPAVTHRVRTA